jgi:hypothetical protein
MVNKTIEELKTEILNNKKQLDKLHFKKNYLIKFQEQVPTAPNPLAAIYNRIFNQAPDTQEQILQCKWEEETVQENIDKLEKEKRMKELATVNDWWKAHEDTILTMISPEDLQSYKNMVFTYLTEELEKDEAAFLQAADKILFDPSLKNN